jgi:hypothetical protein
VGLGIQVPLAPACAASDRKPVDLGEVAGNVESARLAAKWLSPIPPGPREPDAYGTRAMGPMDQPLQLVFEATECENPRTPYHETEERRTGGGYLQGIVRRWGNPGCLGGQSFGEMESTVSDGLLRLALLLIDTPDRETLEIASMRSSQPLTPASGM